MIRVCQKCVNWIEEDNGNVSCDYDHFITVKYEVGILFVPELYECENYEEYVD